MHCKGKSLTRDDAIPRPLNHEADQDTDQEAVPVAFGCKEGGPPGGSRDLPLQFESLADLLILELDQLVVEITIGMVSRENLQSFVVSILGNEPPGRLGNPNQAQQLNAREEPLKKTGNTPAPAVVHKKKAKRHDAVTAYSGS